MTSANPVPIQDIEQAQHENDANAKRSVLFGKTTGGTYTPLLLNNDGSLPLDIDNLVNGTFQETFDALVTSDGTTVTMSLEQSGGGDLTMRFSDGKTTLDTTPAQTISLTAGSDTTPTENFIYIPQSTKVLTKSTSNWPSGEHIKVGYFLVPSATFVQSNGAYINQNWNDHLQGTDNQGHLTHIAERSRRDGAYYFSGVNPNGTTSYLTISGTTVDCKATSGVIYQMHKHTFPAVDTSTGDEVLVKNWNGDSFHNITNLFDIVADSAGGSLTNRWVNLVLWGVGNKTGEYEPIIINLPSGSYSTRRNAEGDVDGFDDFTMPREFGLESSTGFLIARLTVRITNSSWTFGSVVDLRGQTPITASGGASATTTDFADNQFTIFDETDITKILNIDVGTNVTTGTTRTLNVPDANGTIALSSQKSGQVDISADTNLAVIAPITLNADSIGMVNQGTVTTVLHGNALGNPSFSIVDISADTNLAVTSPIVLTNDTLSFSFLTDNTWKGFNTFTKVPTGNAPSNSTVVINPASATTNAALIWGGVGSVEMFTIDKEGDISVAGKMDALKAITGASLHANDGETVNWLDGLSNEGQFVDGILVAFTGA